MLLRHRTSLRGLFVSNSPCPIMTSKHFLNFKPTTSSFNYPDNKTNLYPAHKFISSTFPSKSSPKLVPLSLKPSNLSFSSHASIPRPVSEAYLEKADDEIIIDTPQLKALEVKLKEIGIVSESFSPGQKNGLICPMCKGGDSGEKKLSLFISDDGNSAVWTCFRAKCGWKGSTRAFADVKSSYKRMNALPKVKKIKELSEHELNLEPLCKDVEIFSPIHFSFLLTEG
uniref:Uncharacterized protein n=1 Tax=Lactuca sativa TaxID=4236 RepID=A0A9R1XXD8_LACSA|nr:hypothetical protein LSAT_V11C100037010 [Lactuca sativa]